MIRIEITSDNAGEVVSDLRTLLATLENAPGGTAISSGTVKPPTKRQTAAEKAAAEKQAISTGGERTDPEVSVADQAQDAADEAAETARVKAENDAKAAAEAAAKKAATPAPLTHNDVKTMLGGYVMHFGMAAAQEDGESLIGVGKVSDLADDQKVLAKAIIAVMAGIEKNPKSRDVDGDGITPEKIAQLKPIIAAAKAVLA